MRMLIFLLIFSFAVTHLPAQSNQGNNRLVYLFGPQHQMLTQQLDRLNFDRNGCEERDIKIIIADTVKNQANLYHQYQAKPDRFMVVLIGKDGGEKFRSLKPVSAQQIFAIIDKMPMRQQEIKNNSNH